MLRRSFSGRFIVVTVLVVAIAALGIIAGCASESKDVVARVNGEDITRAELDNLWSQVVLQLGEEPTGTAKTQYQQYILQYLIESKVVQAEATSLGADLSETAVEEGIVSMVGTASTDASLQAELTELGMTTDDLRMQVRDQLSQNFLFEWVSDNTSATVLPETYMLLEHILVTSEETATLLYDRIADGDDFNALATEYSTDTYSALEGGSLGWAPAGTWVPEFASASAGLVPGEVSEPVQSDYGWHIIRKVSEVTTDTPLADCPEEVVSSASETIISDAYYRFIEDLVARADIEYLDATLAPSTDDALAE